MVILRYLSEITWELKLGSLQKLTLTCQLIQNNK